MQSAADGRHGPPTSVSAPPGPLYRVNDRAGIDGLHTLEDTDLAGGPVDGDPEALHVEGDGPRRRVRLADCLEEEPALLGDGVQVRQGDPPVVADDGALLQPAAA